MESPPTGASRLVAGRWWWGAAVATLTVAVILEIADAFFHLQLALWCAAVLLLYGPFVSRRTLGDGCSALASWQGAALVAIVFVAIAARVYRLMAWPAGMYGDEGQWGLWSLGILDGKPIRPFQIGWDFHPTLFNYVQAGAMSVCGRELTGLRIASALAGAATVLAWFVWLRQAAGFPIAFFASVLLAVSPWPVQASRIASNNSFVQLWAVIAIGALERALLSGSTAAWVLSGSSLGMAFYFGNKAVLLPVMMIAVTCAHVASGERLQRMHARGCGLLLTAALFVFAPQVVDYVRNGAYGPLLAHPSDHLVLRHLADAKSHLKADSLAEVAIAQIERSVLAFQYYPDRGPFLRSTGVPLLTGGVATFYLVGLAYCAWRWRARLFAILLAWFGVGLLGSVLSDHPPNAHHFTGMIPVPMAFAAIAIDLLRRGIASADGSARRRWGAAAVTGTVVVCLVAEAARDYVLHYAATQPSLELTQIARATSELAPTHDVVLVTPRPDWNDTGIERFLAYGINAERLGRLSPSRPWSRPGTRDVAFLVGRSRQAELEIVRGWYPNGQVGELGSDGGDSYVTAYFVGRSDLHD